jgi:hypothetical protein
MLIDGKGVRESDYAGFQFAGWPTAATTACMTRLSWLMAMSSGAVRIFSVSLLIVVRSLPYAADHNTQPKSE